MIVPSSLLQLLCVLVPVIALAQISVDVNIMDSTGSIAASRFTYAGQLDPSDTEHADLKAQIYKFCTSLMNAPDHCELATYSEFLKIHQQSQPWISGGVIMESFTRDLSISLCSVEMGYHFNNVEECFREVSSAIRSEKMYRAFTAIPGVMDFIERDELVKVSPYWKDGVEGHTFMYADKLRIMQELADDPRVERVCEIGFNMGHSAVNWLAANPRLSVVAFDVTRQLYTAAAINAINTLFPSRTVSLVTGDSSHSVPNFARLTNEAVKCNVLFIDGGHTLEAAFSDIVNFRALANTSYHRVFIDDVSETNGVFQAMNEAVARKVLFVHHTETVNQTLCLQEERVQDGLFRGAHRFVRIPQNDCNFPLESDYVQDKVVVAEYLF